MSTLTMPGAPSAFVAYQTNEKSVFTDSAKFEAIIGFLVLMFIGAIVGVVTATPIVTIGAGFLSAIAIPAITVTSLVSAQATTSAN